jgi:hypothetical protein
MNLPSLRLDPIDIALLALAILLATIVTILVRRLRATRPGYRPQHFPYQYQGHPAIILLHPKDWSQFLGARRGAVRKLEFRATEPRGTVIWLRKGVDHEDNAQWQCLAVVVRSRVIRPGSRKEPADHPASFPLCETVVRLIDDPELH